MKKTVYRIIGLITLMALLFGSYMMVGASSASASSNSYYVSTTGSDTNMGTSAAPFKTIQKAVNTAASGDTVMVLAGTYPEYVNVNKSLVIQAQGSVKENGFNVIGSNVTISGFDISNQNEATSGIGIYNQGFNNTYQNNYIHDAYWGGIETFATVADPTMSSNSKILNNTIYHVGQIGMDIRGTNILVAGNTLSYIVQYPAGRVNNPSWSDADCFHMHGDSITFDGNICENISYAQPENKDPHIDAFQTFSNDPVHPLATNITIKNNIVDLPYENASLGLAAKLIQCSSGCGNHWLVTNNLVIAPLIGLFNGGNNITIQYNTLVAPAGMTGTYGFQLTNSPSFTLDHNIAFNEQNGVGFLLPDTASKVGLYSDYNCIYRDATHAPYGSPTPHDVWNQDPQFVGGGDYHLQSTSPCLAMGAYASGSTPVVPTLTNTPTSAPTLTPTAAFTSTVTFTPHPTFTSTPIPPTATMTSSPTKAPTSTSTSTPKPPTATATAFQPTAALQATNVPLTSETTYDDTYSLFMFSSRWPLTVNSLAYKGQYKTTNLINSSVQLGFTGQSFSVLYTSGPNYGNMNVYVDNLPVGSIKQTSSSLRFQQRWDYTGQLPYGNHTLKLVFTGPVNTLGTLDAVIVR